MAVGGEVSADPPSEPYQGERKPVIPPFEFRIQYPPVAWLPVIATGLPVRWPRSEPYQGAPKLLTPPSEFRIQYPPVPGAAVMPTGTNPARWPRSEPYQVTL